MSADSAPAAARSWWPLATAVVLFVLVSFPQLAQPDLASLYRDPLVLGTTIAAAIAAIGLVAAYRFGSIAAETMETLWLSFAVGIAFWLSAIETAVPFAADRPVLGFSAVGPWIIDVCLVVRARTSKTMIAALAAASMWPLAYAINTLRLPLPPAPWSRLIVWPALNYAMAALACLMRRSIGAGASRDSNDGLGSYRLLAPIGAGGMGEVWSATHQMLARQAAIKLVRPRQTASSSRQQNEWVQRFQREANTIAGLQSPHTIYLYDFGVARDGQFYYVMELLDGISLETLVKTFGPQPPSRVRHILRQVCESLEEAHQRNLVHRDLKPSNVMLCKLALRHDFVKVLDFGLAKCAACEDVPQITVENVAAGTPGYISPEVALGEDKVDGRADLYALGCVAYYLLTGALVFEDANAMSMVVKHVQAEPVPPSRRTDRPIPDDLERIILKCLEKKPAARPQSARQVAAMLDACDLPVWTEHDAAMWWEQHLPDTSALRVPMPPETRSDQTTRTAVVVEGVIGR
jgi:serine/threonine-protein kinase